MKEKAVIYHKQGDSCSASIIKSAIDEGLCSKELYNAACGFAGGISSGCLCGAVAASIMVLGNIVGEKNAKPVAKEFIEEFKKKHKATCCRVLSSGFEGEERRKNCNKLVEECAEILENMINKIKISTSSTF